MNLFKNKTEKLLESRLQNNKNSLEDKMDALSSYLIYLREHNTKKESEVFMEIIKRFKGNEKTSIFSEQSIVINKETLFLVDKKNKRCLLNNKFCKVMNSFTQIQMTIFANTIEKMQPYLDIFIKGNYKGNTLRIDFKNILSTKSIDFELYLKDLKRENNEIIDTEIKDLLISKNIFIINKEIELDSNLLYIIKKVQTRKFFDAMKYMSEKKYPILLKDEENTFLKYVDIKEIERYIQNEESRFLPFNQFLEYCNELNIFLENDIIILPKTLLKRNSNFYIIEKENKNHFF